MTLNNLLRSCNINDFKRKDSHLCKMGVFPSEMSLNKRTAVAKVDFATAVLYFDIISIPSSVTRTVCSHCAERAPSAVKAVHPLSSSINIS